jgi:hypothetical protein
LENFELVELQNGVMSLRCLAPRETFHPAIGPAAEANILHVEQQKLTERCLAITDFHLWDVGLGAGANVLAAIRAFQRDLPPDHPVLIESFDKTLSPIKFALDHAAELGYLQGFENEIKELLSNGSVTVGENITWRLRGDFTEEMKSRHLRAPDAIFYDPYSAVGNPEMWNEEIFSKVFANLDPERLCLLSNYTASTYIRVTLLLAGFYVGIGCAVDKKVQTTIASNQLDALTKPLDLDWLEKRVRISHSAAPLRTVPHQIQPISEADFVALKRHPQFKSKT